MKTRSFLLILFLAGLSLPVFPQGSLTPPAAPTPTMKTLDQIEARTPIDFVHTPGNATDIFIIGVPGSYYLTGNLIVGSSQRGIRITNSHVTVDLNGFQVVGAGGSSQCIFVAAGGFSDIEIRNGSVSGSTITGVDAVNGSRVRVIDVRVSDCTQNGIAVGANSEVSHCLAQNSSAIGTGAILTGADSTVIDCTTQNSAGGGIKTGEGCIIKDCTASHNTGNGIETGLTTRVSGCIASTNTGIGFNLGSRVVVNDCSAYLNGSNGFSGMNRAVLANCIANNNGGIGISTTSGSSVSNCSANNNSGVGLSLGDAAAVHNCAAFSNTGDGIVVTTGATVSNCNVESNQGTAGISTSSACTVIGCAVRAHTSAAASSGGIVTGTECLVSQCVVSNTTSTAGTLTNTTGMGISVTGASTVERCTVQGCKGDGILVTGSCLVLNNTCDRNGDTTGDGAGIHSTSTENRIEGNSATGNDRGIEVTSTGSLVIKNTAATNTIDYVIAASNRYGPIINITAAGAAAVSFNSASANVASVMGSTDPWANFSY